jgi:hypothetical protein
MYRGAKLIPKKLNIINTASGGAAKWSLFLNGQVQGGTNVPFLQNTFAEFNYEPSAFMPNDDTKEVATGYIYGAGVTEVDLTDHDIKILSSIRGTPDHMTLVIFHLLGTLTVAAGLEWQEIE